MCKYQQIEDGKMPVCGYTKKACTLCVLGNMNTFNEAERSSK